MNKQELYKRQGWILKNITATKKNIKSEKEKANPNHQIITLYKKDLRILIEKLEYVTKLINKKR